MGKMQKKFSVVVAAAEQLGSHRKMCQITQERALNLPDKRKNA